MSHKTRVRILLVEDSPEDVKQFKAAINDDVDISVASTGAEALDRLFRRGKFHDEIVPELVVIDLNVPILSGHEVLNVIRANSETKHLPVVVYSVSDHPDDISKAYELGACAYLVKPMDLSETENQLKAFSSFWLHHVRYSEISGARNVKHA